MTTYVVTTLWLRRIAAQCSSFFIDLGLDRSPKGDDRPALVACCGLLWPYILGLRESASEYRFTVLLNLSVIGKVTKKGFDFEIFD